jgi:hypothetical protein
MEVTLTRDDLPALYKSADKASLDAQRTYFNLLRAGLIFQIVAVAVSLLPTRFGSFVAIIAAVAFGISLLLTIVLKTMHYERTWYGGRAAAESAKTSAWRYAVCAEPYLRQLDDRNADELLTKTLNDVIQQRKNLAGAIASSLEGNEITEKMRTIRKMDVGNRISLYLKGRIKEQREWYSRKSEYSRKAMGRLFYCSILAQFVAFVFAIIRTAAPDFPNITGIFAVVATSVFTWLQAKKHQELVQSYSIAAAELGLIVEKGRHVTTESELSTFVGDAENAISREHTLWVSRRDVL